MGLLPILGALASVVSIIGGGLSIYRMLNPPKLPRIQIPQVDMQALNEALDKIRPISEEARQTIMQAIQRYNRGELSPEAKAKLDSAYMELADRTLSTLRARGVAEGSTIYQKALQQLQNWYQQQYALLLGQDLRNALQLTGLAKADIDALLTKIGVHMNIGQADIQNWFLRQQLGALAGQGLATGLNLISGGLRDFAHWYQQWQNNSANRPQSFYSDDFHFWGFG